MEHVLCSEDQTPIQKFYHGRNILITGGTGFIGKLLIEKLLRSCPGIGSIYVLVRNKKDLNSQERIEKMCRSNVFKNLMEKNASFAEHIVGIPGDCGLPNLGISSTNRSIIIDNVSIVFHAAATVRFNDNLKNAIFINTRGSLEMINLCKEMTLLKAVIHVSTAYACCLNETIEEKFYDDVHVKGRELIDMGSIMDENLSNRKLKKILRDWPNTYTITKAAAEQIIQTEAAELPFGVFRPSIVACAYHEPMEGWIDTYIGATGLVCSASLGLLRTIYSSGLSELNIVPCDMAVHALIAAAWDVAHFRMEYKDRIPIYNYVANGNALSISEIINLIKTTIFILPSNKMLWYYRLECTPYRFLYKAHVYLFHILPALIVDIFRLSLFKKPMMLKTFNEVNKMSEAVEYFTYSHWNFTNDNVISLIEKLSEKDRQLFSFDMRKMDWKEYFKIYIRGIRLYLLNDPMDTLPVARKKLKRLYWIDQITKLVCYCISLGASFIAISKFVPILQNRNSANELEYSTFQL